MKLNARYVLNNLQGYVCDPQHFEQSMSWLGLKYSDTTDWEHIDNETYGTLEIWEGLGCRFELSICHYKDAVEIQDIEIR